MRISILSILLFSLLFSNSNAQSCLPNGITLGSQANVNAFVANFSNCEEIEGFLDIQGATVTDISGLSNLRKVHGNLFIRDCPQLLSLDGLQNLDSVGRGFSLLNCINLNSIDSLYNLKHIHEDFYLQNCKALTDLSGLESLTFVGNELFIGDNDLLENIQALAGLQTVQTNIWIEDNPVLQTLQGLENLSTFGGFFRLLYNQGLQSLCDWSNLSAIQEFVTVIGNNSLINFQGFESITSIGGGIRIENNASLQNLNGLNNLSSIDGDLSIRESNALTDLSALSNLTAINGRLNFEINELLFTLSGLDQIDHTTISELTIVSSPNLSMCAVASICNYLSAQSGPAFIWENGIGCDAIQQVQELCVFLGEQQMEKNQFELYPNPNHGTFHFRMDKPFNSHQTLEIHDLSGRILYSKIIPSGMQHIDIETLGLANGMYLLRISGNESANKTFIIQH
jgi:hypothetical protein